jgi:hypothetical protein
LLALGVDPQSGVPSEGAMNGPDRWAGTPAQWLWVWDQRVGRWLVWPTPLPLPYRWGCGVCLQHGATWTRGLTPSDATASGTYLWLREVLGHGLGDGNVAYRIFVPDAPPGHLSA